jgi:hypothetical protein
MAALLTLFSEEFEVSFCSLVFVRGDGCRLIAETSTATATIDARQAMAIR